MPDETIWDDLSPEERIDELAKQPLRSTGKPPSAEAVEEAKRIAREAQELPPLLTASQLEATQPEPIGPVSDEEAPPDEAVPAFLIVASAFGKGTQESVKLADGTPVGRWLEAHHPQLDGAGVSALLIELGMDAELAARFGKRRDQAIVDTAAVLDYPAVQSLAAAEAQHQRDSARMRAAFLEAMKRKEK